MESKDYLVKSFCISVIAHTLIIYGVPGFSLSDMKRLKQPEVTYYKMQEKILAQELAKAKKEPLLSDIELAKKQEIIREEKSADIQENKKAGIKQEVVKDLEKKSEQIQPKPIKNETQAISLEKNNSIRTKPSFLSYNNLIREKIRKKALYLYDKTYEQGNIYLSFVLENNGRIKTVSIVAEKSIDNEYLEQIAKKSILYSSPFPAFPKELDVSEITFSVLMSFRSGSVMSD